MTGSTDSVPTPQELDGKPLVLWLFEPQEDSNRYGYLVGVAQWDGEKLSLKVGDDKPPFPIFDDWQPRLRRIPDDFPDAVEGAEWYLALPVTPLEEGQSADDPGNIRTGLTWPPNEGPPDK